MQGNKELFETLKRFRVHYLRKDNNGDFETHTNDIVCRKPDDAIFQTRKMEEKRSPHPIIVGKVKVVREERMGTRA